MIAVFLFGFYYAIVTFGTCEKKRTVSVSEQTLLGMLVACTIAALFHATPAGYAAAIVIGVILGFTADFWVKHVQVP